MKLRLNASSRLLVGCLVGGTLALSGAARAHDAKEHAAHVAKPGAADYVRSVRSYAIPDVALTDADGRTVRLRQVLATPDPVMVNFIFTTCGAICPVMSKVFSDVPAKLGSHEGRLRMVSISIDPENDTPAKLKAYAANYGAGARWTFLTGRVEDVKAVQIAFDSFRGDKMSHEPLTLMRSAGGTQWVRLDGFASSDDLAREYRKLAQP